MITLGHMPHQERSRRTQDIGRDISTKHGDRGGLNHSISIELSIKSIGCLIFSGSIVKFPQSQKSLFTAIKRLIPRIANFLVGE